MAAALELDQGAGFTRRLARCHLTVASLGLHRPSVCPYIKTDINERARLPVGAARVQMRLEASPAALHDRQKGELRR